MTAKLESRSRSHTPRLLATAVCGLFLLASNLHSIEISLEENKAARGNIGFIDMQKVFRLYPETHKAKETYEKIVRQAEEQVNIRRGQIITLRSELAKLKLERDLLEKSALPAPKQNVVPRKVTPPPAPEPVLDVSTDSAAVAPENIEMSTETSAGSDTGVVMSSATVSTATLASSATAQMSNQSETFEDLPGMSRESRRSSGPVVINIPGVNSEADPLVVAPPGGQHAPVPPIEIAEGDPLLDREKRLSELDDAISQEQAELDRLETTFLEYQTAVEKNLIEIESRRTEILLGKIYRAVREVARENGVSIVVDKNQILFGQKSVDLTSKVLNRLKGLSL